MHWLQLQYLPSYQGHPVEDEETSKDMEAIEDKEVIEESTMAIVQRDKSLISQELYASCARRKDISPLIVLNERRSCQYIRTPNPQPLLHTTLPILIPEPPSICSTGRIYLKACPLLRPESIVLEKNDSQQHMSEQLNLTCQVHYMMLSMYLI
jgi:hypothetical protein